tara:strand:- start:348 stop:599 length:252 start_codon:yes stop_codon:yes gene_type:complete
MKKQPLKDMLKKIGGGKLLNEVDYTKVVIPAQVKRWMGKFVGAVQEANLNKMKRLAILFAVIKALGISQKELLQYIQRIKREV